MADLCNGKLKNVHDMCVNFYADDSFDYASVLSHFISLQTGKPVSRLLQLVVENLKLLFTVCCNSIPASEYTVEPLQRVYEDVPHLLLKIMCRKNINTELLKTSCAELGLEGGVCNDPNYLRPKSTNSTQKKIHLQYKPQCFLPQSEPQFRLPHSKPQCHLRQFKPQRRLLTLGNFLNSALHLYCTI